MNNIFQNIPDKNIPRLLRFLEAHTYNFAKDSKISSIVSEDGVICIVQSGYLQIIKTDHNGNTTIIEQLEENSVFGSLMQSFKNNEYDIDVKEDSQIIVIDFANIIYTEETSISAFTQFMKNLLYIMSTKIAQNNERIEILTNKTIRNKLLAYFKVMRNKNKSDIIYLPSSFTDLALYLAIDRSAMTRELKNLKEEGLIEIKGKKIKLLYYIN